jgi:CBS domain-containing protein
MQTGFKVGDGMTMDPITVLPDTLIVECAKILAENKIGSLIVVEENELKGIVTEFDMVRKIILECKDPREVKVKEIMVKKLITITPEKDIYDALVKMKDNDVRHLPVVNGSKLVGFLTLKDILKVEPELFDVMAEHIDIREEEDKSIGDYSSGVCSVCGIHSNSLAEHNGTMVCRLCRSVDK